MSPLLVALAACALLYPLAQFGGQLSASRALNWYAVSAFLLVVAARPELLRPIADVLGIEFVSNLVLAAMVVFLLAQVLDLISDTTRADRTIRTLISSLAADDLDRAPSADSERTRVLVVLPCFNEQGALPAILESLATLDGGDDLEIDWVVVDDGSTDGSRAVLREHAPTNHVGHRANLGVAGVLLTGFEIAARCGFEYTVQCDADGQHPVDEIPRLVRSAIGAKADLTIGSRFVPDFGRGEQSEQDGMRATTPLRRGGALIIRGMLRLFGSTAAAYDPTSGFRAYSPAAMAHLQASMPDEYPEPETLASLALAGLTVFEVPVRMQPRTSGNSTIVGLGTVRYMIKVSGALIGLRLRSVFRRRSA